MKRFTTNILISGSPLELLRLVQKQFDFTELYATTGCIEQGVYTGDYRKEDERATAEAKERLIRALNKRLHFDPDTSFAFGDSESDIPLLEVVNPQNSFVLGAREELIRPAKTNGWTVLKYEDDVVSTVRARVLEVFPQKQ